MKNIVEFFEDTSLSVLEKDVDSFLKRNPDYVVKDSKFNCVWVDNARKIYYQVMLVMEKVSN